MYYAYSKVLDIISDAKNELIIVIDSSIIYHSGNSINRICFRKSSIDAINDYNIKKKIIKDINEIINS